MKIALFADIHSNLEALQACLGHAGREGAGKYVFLGDLVGYGADPVACLALIAQFAEQGALCVRGNHDAAALGGSCEHMVPLAQAAIHWTRTQLGSKERAFLATLPLTERHGDLCFVHASAHRPEAWSYISGKRQAALSMDATDAAISFAGHVHNQMLYSSRRSGGDSDSAANQTLVPAPGEAIPLAGNRHWLAIAGSVGQPRDGRRAAAYALFDEERRMLTFFRVPYDYQSAARKIIAAGLPEQLAWQLRMGE